MVGDLVRVGVGVFVIEGDEVGDAVGTWVGIFVGVRVLLGCDNNT
jgi:hypothetical protein